MDVLKHHNLSPKLQNFALYSIAFLNNADASITAEEGMNKVKKFVSSIGVYSSNPFLAPLYGVSELPQAFCRLCAVFGGLYVLRRSVTEIHLENNTFKNVLDTEGQILTGQHLIINAEYVPKYCQEVKKVISRCVCVTDTSLINGESLILSVIPPGICGNQNAVRILQLDSGASVCAKGKYLVHFTMESDVSCTASKDLQQIVSQLLTTDLNDQTKPKILYYAYFNESIIVPQPAEQIPTNMYVCASVDADIDCSKHVDEAKAIFSKICPNEVFLPRAPEPEEIIYDDAPQEPDQNV